MVRRSKLRFAILPTALAVSIGWSAGDQPVLVVNRPTIVAFFPPVKRAQLKTDPDTNEALADFHLYVAQVREPLQKAGIDLYGVYTLSFRIRIGVKERTFRSGDSHVGYYFIAPGRKPRIEYGVQTDIGLLQIASEYFGIVAK